MTVDWNHLDKLLAQHAPDLMARMRPGASEQALRDFEAETGQALPDDVRRAYLRHDGCDSGDFMKSLGFFPWQHWVPLHEALADWRGWREDFSSEDLSLPDEVSPDIPLHDWSGAFPPQWLTIGMGEGGCSMFVDLVPAPAGRMGQLVWASQHGGCCGVMAGSFDDYARYLADGLESGRIVPRMDPDTNKTDWELADGGDLAPPGRHPGF